MKQENDAAKLKEQIDENLKRVYQEVLDQNIPDRLKDLLAQLRQKNAMK